MIWRWHWQAAWRTLRGRCLGCGSKTHVICLPAWAHEPDHYQPDNTASRHTHG